MTRIPRKYDDDMRELLPVGMPLQYGRALAWRESSMDAREKTGGHWGLFQIGKVALDDINKFRSGRPWTLPEMLLARPNIEGFGIYYTNVISKVFDLIIARAEAVGKGHLVRDFARDWKNPNYVLLVTMAWNSGPGVVRRAAERSVGAGKKANYTNVIRNARRLGSAGDRRKATGSREVWQRSVLAVYRDEVKTSHPLATAPKPKGKGGLGWLVIAALVLMSFKN